MTEIAVGVTCLGLGGMCMWAFKYWVDHQPPCTAEEFSRLVKQVNLLTESMTIVQQTSDSLRTAVGMSNMGRLTKVP